MGVCMYVCVCVHQCMISLKGSGCQRVLMPSKRTHIYKPAFLSAGEMCTYPHLQIHTLTCVTLEDFTLEKETTVSQRLCTRLLTLICTQQTSCALCNRPLSVTAASVKRRERLRYRFILDRVCVCFSVFSLCLRCLGVCVCQFAVCAHDKGPRM